MSNDLISRSALIEEISSYIFEAANPDERRGEHAAKAYICELIDKQPTAYDVDKIVELLKSTKFNEQETILADIHQGFNSGIEFSIKMIKAGGVNE